MTTKNAWGPNTLIKQGAKLVATWEDVWEDLPTQVRSQLGRWTRFCIEPEPAASIVEELPLQQPEKSDHERACATMKRCSLDELMEMLESKLTLLKSLPHFSNSSLPTG